MNDPRTDAAPAADTPDIWIGFDTGGTYTDAVALDQARRVIASAKSLTTPWDLSVGLAGAIRAVLAQLPPGVRGEHISLVSVSTTLATNAVVENRFSPVCTILVGFSDEMAERSGLKSDGELLIRVRGGHEATGEESQPLDVAAVEAAVREVGGRVDAFAVAATFSVRNPDHERRVRELIRCACHKPVTCSYELSSQLDAPRRALTAALNARLTPQIHRLLGALTQVLGQEGIQAPLMIVKGDGTLVRAEVALECPVETVLSGPAASLVGAGFLTGLTSFAVSDMGGTTTDVAIVIDGRPGVSAEGAVIAGWRTMVEAVDVRTWGLGGDSEVYIDRHGRLAVGPRKVMPLSLLAQQFPQVLPALRQLAAGERVPLCGAQFAFRNPGRDPGAQFDGLEQRIWQGLAAHPRRSDEVARTRPGIEALQRLVDRGYATVAGFTPSDALHVLGRQRVWNEEASRLGAMVLAVLERNVTAGKQRDLPESLCERTYEHVVREATRVVLEGTLARDPGLEPKSGRWGPLGALIDETAAGRAFSQLLDAQLKLAIPLVAIGAPAATYYPEVARRLGARLVVPEHAAVCNAVGAVAGVVAETCEVLVNQPSFSVFRVHDPSGAREYAEEQPAIEDAKRVSRELALAAARRAGAHDPHVVTSVAERRANAGQDDDYLAEATVRSTATGRPRSAGAAS
jgi:N-methylhydantoinase A/oxoprolinase/acetone carboxylase beta subunit